MILNLYIWLEITDILVFFDNRYFCDLITGHRRINNPEISMDFSTLTKNKGKIIVYMGVSQLEVISENLIKNGLKKIFFATT